MGSRKEEAVRAVDHRKRIGDGAEHEEEDEAGVVGHGNWLGGHAEKTEAAGAVGQEHWLGDHAERNERQGSSAMKVVRRPCWGKRGGSGVGQEIG